PDYRTDLYDKYLSPSSNQVPVLTKEEVEYIEAADEPIHISYDPSFAPFSYKDAEGELNGIMADIFARIAEKSGLDFQFEACPAATALRAVKLGETDAVSVVDGDYLWDERNHMNTTLRFLNTPSAMITQAERTEIEVLALPEGYQLSEHVAQNNPEKEIQYYDSIQACFDAVLDGKAQATYTNTQTANYIISDPKYEKLHVTALTQYPNDLCIGVSKSADPRLFSILDKYIQYMSNEEIDTLLLNNSVSVRPITMEAFVHQNIWLITGLVAAVSGSIILLLCINLFNISRSKRRIQDLLYRDELTGLDNINRFYVRAEELLATGKYAVVYCDIDRFKLINDTFGFEEGDEVLRAFGSILQKSMEDRECCARLSADNFVMLRHYKQWETLAADLMHIQAVLNKWRGERGIIPYEIAVSFGVYQADAGETNDMKQMLDFANYAMRSAKTAAGGSCFLYDEQMRNKALFEQGLEGRLASAMEQGEFEAYYQPKVDMDTGRIVGCEALVRWNHPEQGLLMPGSFIPFFEKKGLIVRVDLHMFEQVCRTVRRWLDEGRPAVTVSCNFSQMHFGHDGFAGQVSEIADRFQVPHHLLEVEITESAIADAPESVSSALTELKMRGFQIAIDDFGSGYSSLGQLQRLRADVLKLDRSFVCAGLQGPREQIVIENLVNMASELGMEVVCEGVETQVQVKVLQDIGCHIAQGYYYYRPMQTAAFEQLLG
ncbi:EAL domain-containing protein, partial [Enterocloster bolteae]|uniref:EAL domain-containing protein n=2 Tax=Lachnospiraceae TaxID=186803 RepID=UPI002665F620